MVNTPLYFITAALYLLLGLRDLISRQPAPAGTTDGQSSSWRAQGLLFLTLVVHAALLHRVLFASHQMVLSLGNSLSLVGAATAAMYWLASFRCRLGVLQSVLMLIVAGLVLAPLVLPAEKPVEYSHLLICIDPSSNSIIIPQIILQCVGSRTNSMPTVDQSDMRGLVTA